MPLRHRFSCRTVAGGVLVLALIAGCAPEYRPWFLGGGKSRAEKVTTSTSNPFSLDAGPAFTEVLIQSRTFTQGRVVTSVTHRTGDMGRNPVLIDFNGDGKVDPVVGYAQDDIGIIQLLLSYGPVGATQYASLTFDGGENQWSQFSDLAIGDIDGDGNLDIVAATGEGVVYLHHPSDAARTHVLGEWGATEGALELVNGTADSITEEELSALLTQVVGPGGKVANYAVEVQQGYTSVEIGDFDNDGYNDIAASRQLHISLTPLPTVPVDPLEYVAGTIQLLINPRHATTGESWSGIALGLHERHNVPDREGARDLRAYDIDGDGDLDLISTATGDDNVQVAWFENPGGPGVVDPGQSWLQHRIGSVRGAYTVDVADVTGDGRVDVVVTSPDQQQLVLFLQPESVADRGYDWYTVPIVTFENFEPRSVKAIDVNNDGQLELALGGTNGALRYFEPGAIPTDEWTGHVIVDFDPPGDVGLLGYGDLDGDGDVDIVAVVSGGDAAANYVSWIRNELLP